MLRYERDLTPASERDEFDIYAFEAFAQLAKDSAGISRETTMEEAIKQLYPYSLPDCFKEQKFSKLDEKLFRIMTDLVEWGAHEQILHMQDCQHKMSKPYFKVERDD